jgi:MFS family permease
MRADRRNVLLLAVCQALMLSAIVLATTVSAVVGTMLAPDRGLATAPIAAMVIGTALATLPAAAFMRQRGRRAGFVLGAGLGAGGGLLAAYSVLTHAFALFVAAHLLIGAWQGFANYHRFAATEAASAQFASRAISLVIAGGVVAAFLGPQLVSWTRDAFAPHAFVGAYMALAGLGAVALLALTGLDRLLPAPSGAQGSARGRREIARQPAFIVAVLGATVGYAVMLLAMTATPVAMLGCGLPATAAAQVIQWHVLAMFAPSFFTGALVQRFGAMQVMLCGFALLAGHVIVALSGVAFAHFVCALVLLGVGWNFSFVGSTALLTHTYRPPEQAKTQAANDFTVFTVVAIASLSSGWLHDRFGWQALNLVGLAALAVAVLAIVAFERRQRLMRQAA